MKDRGSRQGTGGSRTVGELDRCTPRSTTTSLSMDEVHLEPTASQGRAPNFRGSRQVVTGRLQGSKNPLTAVGKDRGSRTTLCSPP